MNYEYKGKQSGQLRCRLSAEKKLNTWNMAGDEALWKQWV